MASSHWPVYHWVISGTTIIVEPPVAGTSRWEKLHNLLIARATAFDFPVLTFDKDTHLANSSVETTSPDSAIADESGGSFEGAVRYGASIRQRRTGWSWEMTLSFNRRVQTDLFERDLSDDPPRLHRDGDDPPIILRLVDVSRDNGGGHFASRGTKVTYSFDAEILSV